MPRMDTNHPRGKHYLDYLPGEGKIAAIKRIRSTSPIHLGLAEAKAIVDTWGEPPAVAVSRLLGVSPLSHQWGKAPEQAVLPFDGDSNDFSWKGARAGVTDLNSDQTTALIEELSRTARRYRDAYEDLELRHRELYVRLEDAKAQHALEYQRVCDERDSLAADLREAFQ